MPVLVSLPVCMPDDAHEDDGQAETDSGSGGVCGGRAEPVRLCGILPAFRNQGVRGHKMVLIVMKYRMKLPFSILGLSSVPVQHVCSRRMWNGADGGRFGQGETSDSTKEELVYIGKNPTRYHRQRTCHYLYNDLKAVSAGEVESMRNQSGGKYVPCKTCGTGNGNGTGTVYIMPYGGSYHTVKTCPSIIAYVQAVALSQVEYLGECSYCGGK